MNQQINIQTMSHKNSSVKVLATLYRYTWQKWITTLSEKLTTSGVLMSGVFRGLPLVLNLEIGAINQGYKMDCDNCEIAKLRIAKKTQFCK